jgi:hypothetical protein
MMTYDDRKMCIGYANMINVADGIQYIYRVGAYDLLSPEAKRKLSNAEAEIQEVMHEMHKYVADHMEDDKEKKR